MNQFKNKLTAVARRIFPLGLPLAMIGLLQAGVVETKDHKTHLGQLSLAAPNSIQIKPANGEVMKVPLLDIVRANFEDSVVPVHGEWSSRDIGEVYLPGSTAETNDTFTLRATGWGLFSGTDALRFTSQTLMGNGQIVAHIAHFQEEKCEVVAGLSIRESLEPSAKHASLMLFSTNKVRFRSRTGLNQHQELFEPVHDLAPQPWLRLGRQGDQFTAYISSDGKNWKFLGQKFVPMNKEVFIGLATSTRINAFTGGAVFDNVAVATGPWAGALFRDLPSEGVVLRDGTVLSGKPTSQEGTIIRLSSELATNTIAVELIAALLFRPAATDAILRPERTAQKGLMLLNGDVLEGDLREIAQDNITVRSVLFGSKKLSISREAVALVLGGINEASPQWVIRLHDGSRVTGTTIALETDRVLVTHPALGKITVPVKEIVEIRSMPQK